MFVLPKMRPGQCPRFAGGQEGGLRPGWIDPMASRPTQPRPALAALPCAVPTRPARSVPGSWIRQVFSIADNRIQCFKPAQFVPAPFFKCTASANGAKEGHKCNQLLEFSCFPGHALHENSLQRQIGDGTLVSSQEEKALLVPLIIPG